jgi:hypothetical protein
MGALYHQIGPRLAAIAFPEDMKPQLKALVEAEFTKVGHDPTAASKAPRAVAVAGAEGSSAGAGGAGAAASASGGIPRQDLCSMLDKNIIAELNYIEGKTSWQRRKAAMESIIAACERSAHYLDANKPTGEVVKALKPRMSDTQANLKPLAVSAIAHVVASLDQRAAGAKVLTMMAQAMMLGLADNKKPMRDSTITALQLAVTGQVEPEGSIPLPADPAMLMACIPAAAESLVNVVGRQELLAWLLHHTDSMKGDLSELVVPLVLTLQDKAAMVRASAEQLLTTLLAHSLTTKSALDKATRDLPPATKRGMQACIDRMMAAHGTAPAKPVAGHAASTAAAPVPDAAAAESVPAPAVDRAPAPSQAPAAAPPAPVETPASPPRRQAAPAASVDSPPAAPAHHKVIDSPALPVGSRKVAAVHTPVPPTPPTHHHHAAHGAPTPGTATGQAWLLKRNAVGKLRRQEEGHRPNWPQPPDEPGEMEIAALKVVWRPIVTPELAYLLFPIVRPGSPVNQDVYMPAMNELSTQLLCPYLTHHTEFLLRWCCIVLCLKQESGPGLLRLLQLVCDLLEALYREAGTSTLTDAEVNFILPHLVDRSGHRSEKHSALYRQSILLIGQIIGPGKLASALAHGLRSHNKRSRVICLEELQGLVETDGAIAHLAPSVYRDIAACLDSRDCDNTVRGACLELITVLYNLTGKDLSKLKKSLGSDLSDVTMSLIEDRVEGKARRQAATPAGPTPASASQLTRTPAGAAAPSTVTRTPSIKAQTQGAPNTAVPTPAPAPVATTPPVSGEKLILEDAEDTGNSNVWNASEEAAAMLSPEAKKMLAQVDQVISATPLPSQHWFVARVIYLLVYSLIVPHSCLSSQRNTREGSGEKAGTPSYGQSPSTTAEAGTPLAAAAPASAPRPSVAQTPEDEHADTIGSLPSEFRSPAPMVRPLSSRMSLSRGEPVDEVCVVCVSL